MHILLNDIPADADAAAVAAFLTERGLDDATGIEVLAGDGSAPAATFDLPVSAAVAETIALHLTGKAWNGCVLRATVLITPGSH